MAADMIREMLRMTNINEKPQLQVFIEEDFLVPDIKPDLVRIVSVDGMARLGEKENFGGSLRVGGELTLNILYVPSAREEELPLEVMEVKTAFRHDEPFADTGAELEITPSIEHLDYSVINERKLRIKAILALNIREYQMAEKNLFTGFRNEPLEVLKETVEYTDLAQRKKDRIAVKEDARIRDGMPEIGRILKSDVSVGETYRQISADKAIISGAVYYHILYLSDAMQPEPVFFQGRIDFTQFFRLEGIEEKEITASDVQMLVEDVRILPKTDEDENTTIFDITADISTNLDVYCEKTAEITKDAYHSRKAVDIESEQIEYGIRKGSGNAEAAVKEMVGLPVGAEPVAEVLYMAGNVFPAGAEIEQDRAVIEGVLEVEIIYRSGKESGFGGRAAASIDDGYYEDSPSSSFSENGSEVLDERFEPSAGTAAGGAFGDGTESIRSFTEEIPFRTMVEIPGLEEGMEIRADFFVKRTTFEKVSDRQIEVFAEIAASVSAWQRESKNVIKSAAVFEDVPVGDENETRVVLYVARNGDSVWEIGKRYKTPAADIRMVNGLGEEEEPAAGRKMLIWC